GGLWSARMRDSGIRSGQSGIRKEDFAQKSPPGLISPITHHPSPITHHPSPISRTWRWTEAGPFTSWGLS
ncbi:MAG: hypothetical protein QF879_22610, partial [Candidatus Latescibacteria bacterium]|nr:hypothetical protein [Candidatus Latescibacterota bacterium]